MLFSLCYVLLINSYVMYWLGLLCTIDSLTPQGSIVWGSAAQTTDGKYRVRALGFHLVFCPAWGATRGLKVLCTCSFKKCNWCHKLQPTVKQCITDPNKCNIKKFQLQAIAS